MRPPTSFSGSRRHGWQTARRRRGFTIPELLIALTIFLFILAGITYAHLFGLKMFQMINTKLQVTQWARQTMENLNNQIHSGYSVQVGNVTSNGFAGFLPGEANLGNSVLIQPDAGSTNTIIYFVNPADQTFRRTDASGNTVNLADSVTNTLAFSAQDFSGAVQTNNINNNQVIHVILEFYHPETFMERADYYKLETSIKQRVVMQ